jgi:aspartyl-tRNA(Asn)/glutamyl-tRNA(Gln) amidotransferase subunit A
MSDSITRRELIAGAAAAALVIDGAEAQRASGADDLTSLSIAEAGRRIAARQLTSLDLTRAYLERIERLNPTVNAYITVTADAALEQARALDEELTDGRNRGPLHGIPLGLKDNIDTAHIRTTAASAVYAERIPAEDAPVVELLRNAGAVFLGKLNMHEFAYGGTCVVSNYGAVHNPWSLAHTPGGSSGGSAAAVAARMCAGALGTDTAASIRFPASCCGVVGLKATHGLASIRGIVPLSEMHDHVGPLARSVEDAALIMRALVGYDPLDAVSIRAESNPIPAAISHDVAGLVVAVPRTPFYDALDPDIDAAMKRALEVVGRLARVVADVEFPATDYGFATLNAEIYEYHAELVADPARRALYKPVTLERILGAANVSAKDYIRSRRQMIVARNTIGELFESVDLLVTPTNARPPPTIEESLVVVPGEGLMVRNTLPFNVLGLPTISVPCGFTRAGLPVGLQITGPRLGEARVLALANAFEQATEWHAREPRLR